MQFREVAAVYSDSRKVHATALCGLNEGFWIVKAGDIYSSPCS